MKAGVHSEEDLADPLLGAVVTMGDGLVGETAPEPSVEDPAPRQFFLTHV